MVCSGPRCGSMTSRSRPAVAMSISPRTWMTVASAMAATQGEPGVLGEALEERRPRSGIDAALAGAGWIAVRVWEHETPDAAAAMIGGGLLKLAKHLHYLAPEQLVLLQVHQHVGHAHPMVVELTDKRRHARGESDIAMLVS